MPPQQGPHEEDHFYILLAEDSAANQALLLAFLKNMPCHLDIVDNGEMAVEKFKKGRYDLVLMDVVMPIMDGYRATALLREWEAEKGLKRTPIIAFTAHDREEDKQRSIASGCDGHLTKPIRKQTLLETVTKYRGRVTDDAKE